MYSVSKYSKVKTDPRGDKTKRKYLYGVAAWEVTADAICGKLTPDTMSGLIHVLGLKNIQTQNLS